MHHLPSRRYAGAPCVDFARLALFHAVPRRAECGRGDFLVDVANSDESVGVREMWDHRKVRSRAPSSRADKSKVQYRHRLRLLSLRYTDRHAQHS